MNVNKIYNENCLTGLKKLPDNSIDCCVTSPPYFGLRDYGTSEQIGLEETPELFIEKLTQVFAEVKRVLKPEGTLWLNLGDSYSSQGGGQVPQTRNANRIRGSDSQNRGQSRKPIGELKPKDLIGIPWMAAFSLRANGWYLRQDIIWHKPNPMPESVTDRCTKSHEYIFLLSKSPKYYYDIDAIRTPVKDSTVQRMMQQIEEQKGSERVPGKTNGTMKAVGPGRKPAPQDNRGGNQGSTTGIKAYSHRGTGDKKLTGHSGNFDSDGNLIGDGMANKKSVWTVTTKPFSEAHFATFPQDLIIDMIKAGCPEFVCNECGKARERIVENEYKVHENWYGDKTKETKNSRGKAGNSYKEKIGINQVGFTDCECNAGFSPGVVLDPFMGAGTTALVARKLNRNYIGFELNPEYLKIAEKRLHGELGMFI